MLVKQIIIPIFVDLIHTSMILVTGGTGLVGSHLLFELLKEEKEVRVLKRKTSDIDHLKKIFGYYTDSSDKLFSKIEWFEADLNDQYDTDSAIKGMEYVYHLAAQISFNPADKYSVLRTNIKGTSHIVDACLEHRVKKLCFVSSISAIGSIAPGEKISDETYLTAPGDHSSYVISKYKSELEVWRGMNEGLNAIIVNPSIIIGPGNWHRGSGKLFQQVWSGLRYYPEGTLGFVDVRDVVKAMICLMNGQFSGEKYLISSENLSYKEILEMIARALGKPLPFKVPGSLMINILCWLDRMRSMLTGKERYITRELVAAANEKRYFSNKKIIKATGIKFIPVNDAIIDTSRLFLRDMNR
jgi:dihydroflavonol-4-reductase